jgi:tetratricopeptide (TPR) repeat protein
MSNQPRAKPCQNVQNHDDGIMMFGLLPGRGSISSRAAALAVIGLALHVLLAADPGPAWAGSPWVAAVDVAANAEYQRQMARGDELAVQAVETRGMRLVQRQRWVSSDELAMRAVAAYAAAAAARPDQAEPHYRAAEVLHAHFLESPSTASDPVLRDRELPERALAHWQAFAERAPWDPRVTTTLFDRALVYTRLATEPDFVQAVALYEMLIERSDLRSLPAEQVATWLANLAETYMMVGRLGDAIETYQRALEYRAEPAYGYGLAVALDRDGQTALAREVMLSYAAGDQMRDLQRGSVFFVPEGEVDYYLALGYDALDDLDQAVKHYRRFVVSGAHPRYQARANENLRRIEKAMSRSGRRPAPSRPERSSTTPKLTPELTP